MNANELDSTMILFNYYRDEAITAIPKIEQEYDENSMIETVRLYASNNDYTWLNIYEGQRPIGFVAGYASSCPWNKNILSANIAFIFLLESHRTLENFRQLMAGFEEWARFIQAVEVTAGDIGIDMERRQRLYEHFDFKPILMMTKELNNE
jgi:hypothetical protein